MSDLDLCYLPATEAIARFKAKTLSPVELMEATIARAEAVEPKVNAFTFTYYDAAMEQAKAAEARYAAGTPNGPLDGLPVCVKDEADVDGQQTSSGSLIYKDRVATHSSPINQRVLDAGGIVHARTATPEFSCAGYCWSRLWGVTRNPWSLEHTPGGSSGGTGASLAAGTASIGTGSDIGGSIRIPASACGLVGFKPPYGRNPEEWIFNLDFYCHNGPMARTVKDTILLQNQMAGPHPQDIATLKPKLTLPDSYAPIRGMKVAFSMDLGIYPVDPEVQKNTLAALDVLRDLGVEVVEVDLGWEPRMYEAGVTYLQHLFGGYIGRLLKDHGDEMTTYARDFAEKAQLTTGAQFVDSLEVAGEMYSTLGPILEEHSALICPTLATPAVKADFDQSKDTCQINGQEVDPFLGWVMTSPFNTLSRCPVLSVPSGRASNGVPTGIQIVGPTYCDADVFQIGMAYEEAAGGWFGGAESRPSI
ncbi:amidase [Rhodobacteraceae bacterium NNCM2]|nr:amidase [Coraliihabitans acroporae]